MRPARRAERSRLKNLPEQRRVKTGRITGDDVFDDVTFGTLSLDGSLTLVEGVLDMDELPTDPSAPVAGRWRLYFKAGGLYVQDDAASVTGPLS